MKKRQESREQAFVMIFEKLFNPDYEISQIADIARESELFDADGFACGLAEKTCASLEEIDGVISECLAKGWKISRLSRVVLSILRLSVCEIMYFDNIPAAVSINEAVELAKKYAPEGNSAFVNALLGSAAKKIGENADNSDEAAAESDNQPEESPELCAQTEG